MDTILFLTTPFIACILLVVVLSYFGNHILTREVIFVDIAVAQVAALGTMLGILIGAAEGSLSSSLVSLGFTLLIVSVFAISKFQNKELSQEVIIGIIYCMALAIVYFLIDAVPGGSNFVHKTFTGAILWVTWQDILRIFIIFTIIGIIHIFIYDKTIMVSEAKFGNLEPAKIHFYNLIFYITFGFVVVEAVKITGIFLVFMFLICPAAISVFFTNKWKQRIIISWIIGLLGSTIGLGISYHFNLPNGPTIVCILGIMLIIVALTARRQELNA